MSGGKKDYEVGKGKPPKKTRFQKGKSGNPKGRPKGSKNFDTELDAVLNKKVTVIENGRAKKVTTQEAVLRKLTAKALEGNNPSLGRYLDLAQQRSVEKEANASERRLSGGEEDILRRYVDSCHSQSNDCGSSQLSDAQDGDGSDDDDS